MIDKLEQARAVVRGHPIPDALRRLGEEDLGSYGDEDGRLFYFNGSGTVLLRAELTPEVLAQSLHYMVKLKLRTIPDEYRVPLGSSKYKGLPHLPIGSSWPRRRYFMAQFNLAELAPYDLYGAFPPLGMLYIFFDPGGEVTIIHYDGPLDQLHVAPYPDWADNLAGAKYYLKGFKKIGSLITYRPKGAFYIGADAYDLSETKKLIPKELRKQVASILGGPVTSWDTDCRIFGRPMYWQGENEFDDDDAPDSRHLLFQDEFGEGHIHVWVDASDARRHDYSRCWMDYSGT